MIAEAATYLRIAAVSQLGICAEIVLEGALGGAGATLPPMLTSTAITASRDSARRVGGGALGERRALVDHLAHGAAARGRDDGHLARRALEADLIASRA